MHRELTHKIAAIDSGHARKPSAILRCHFFTANVGLTHFGKMVFGSTKNRREDIGENHKHSLSIVLLGHIMDMFDSCKSIDEGQLLAENAMHLTRDLAIVYHNSDYNLSVGF